MIRLEKMEAEVREEDTVLLALKMDEEATSQAIQAASRSWNRQIADSP